MTTKRTTGATKVFVLALAATGILNASPGDRTISGYGSFEAGQIVEGRTPTSLHNLWMSQAIAGLVLDMRLNERARTVIGAEGAIHFSHSRWSALQDFGGTSTRLPQYVFYMTQAQGIYLFGDTTRNSLLLGAGYFPFKYNDQARNLGEYLFRALPYPNFIDNSFDFPLARLLGFRVEATTFGLLKHDVLFTSESKNYPLMDFSLAYLLKARVGKFLTCGAGIDFDRLFSVREEYTRPEEGGNIYLENADTTIDPGTGFDVISGDTGYYTFAGTKVMLNLCFDIKGLIPMPFLGAEDLKIYAEAAILGLKNYPNYYEELNRRMPIMVGVNAPTFKILDVLSFELQWFDTPYPNSSDQIFYDAVPQPVFDKNSPMKDNSAFRWSFYAKRTVADMFTFTGQIARDHTRPLFLKADQPETFDALQKKGDWMWMLKIGYGF